LNGSIVLAVMSFEVDPFSKAAGEQAFLEERLQHITMVKRIAETITTPPPAATPTMALIEGGKVVDIDGVPVGDAGGEGVEGL
jgi:hypothetical protein